MAALGGGAGVVSVSSIRELHWISDSVLVDLELTWDLVVTMGKTYLLGEATVKTIPLLNAIA